MAFIKDMITLNAKDYLQTAMDIYINAIVFIIATVLCCASFLINHHKSYTILLIKQLLRRNATSEENAKTLAQLHLEYSKSIKAALNRRGQLTDIVKMAGYKAPTYEEYIALQKSKKKAKEEKIDFSSARFFIPEQQHNRAKLLQEKENPTVFRTVLVCLFIVAISVCIALLMPEILRLVSNLASKV